jgi:AcrR family transcriptional regulator
MRPRQISDEEILQTARRCFLQHGPGLSTAKIAAELGVSQAVLFKRFGSKRALLVASLVDREQPRWMQRVQAGPSDAPLREQLLEIATAIDHFFAELAPAMSTLRASGIHPAELMREFDEPPPLRAVRLLKEWFCRARERGLVDIADAHVVATSFLGALHLRHMHMHLLGPTPAADAHHVVEVVETFLRGVATPKGGTT